MLDALVLISLDEKPSLGGQIYFAQRLDTHIYTTLHSHLANELCCTFSCGQVTPSNTCTCMSFLLVLYSVQLRFALCTHTVQQWQPSEVSISRCKDLLRSCLRPLEGQTAFCRCDIQYFGFACLYCTHGLDYITHA